MKNTLMQPNSCAQVVRISDYNIFAFHLLFIIRSWSGPSHFHFRVLWVQRDRPHPPSIVIIYRGLLGWWAEDCWWKARVFAFPVGRRFFLFLWLRGSWLRVLSGSSPVVLGFPGKKDSAGCLRRLLLRCSDAAWFESRRATIYCKFLNHSPTPNYNPATAMFHYKIYVNLINWLYGR